MKPGNPNPDGAYGYHSGISATQENTKWLQVDLGKSVAVERVVLKPCHDDFNGIGAGFGFPIRYRVEISEDASFKGEVVTLLDGTAEDQPKQGLRPLTDVHGRVIRELLA